jgi:D-alanyl-D-alanine carboxypeptidase
LATAHPAGPPGATWAYANTNYVVLGLIVEAVTGASLESALRARIFEPLDLTKTSLDPTPAIDGTFAHGYAQLGGPAATDVTGVSPSAAWAAGGIVSTADDLAKFYGALMDGAFGSDALKEMLTTVPAQPGIAYGLGIAAIDVPCGTAWGHRGEFPGYLSFALSSRTGDRQAVVLVNYYSLTEAGHAAFEELVGAALCG